jgi:hypothetical protein
MLTNIVNCRGDEGIIRDDEKWESKRMLRKEIATRGVCLGRCAVKREGTQGRTVPFIFGFLLQQFPS